MSLAFVLVSSGAVAANHCANEKIEPFVKRLAQAWASKQLGGLDSEKPYRGSVQFVIEHAITDAYEVEEQTSFEAIEQWLRSQESEGFPAREARPLVCCKKGLCVFDFSAGIAHNHRYMQKVTYEKQNGCIYIKSVFLLDGDWEKDQ